MEKIFALCSEIYRNIPCGGKSVEILSFKHCDTKNNHLVLKADMERTKSYDVTIRNYLFLIK